jgi:hypothetical protein
MDYHESKNRCARLTGDVCSTSVESFYNKFNLIDTPYLEFFFKDMLEIYHLEGMDQWPAMCIHPQATKEQEDG